MLLLVSEYRLDSRLRSMPEYLAWAIIPRERKNKYFVHQVMAHKVAAWGATFQLPLAVFQDCMCFGGKAEFFLSLLLLFLSYLFPSFLPPFISGKNHWTENCWKCFMSAVVHLTLEAWKPPGCIKTSQQWLGISTMDCIPVSLPLGSKQNKTKKTHARYQIKFPQGGESLQKQIVECWANTKWAVLLSPTDVSLRNSISCLWYFRFSVLFGSKQTLIHQNFIKAEIHILGLC